MKHFRFVSIFAPGCETALARIRSANAGETWSDCRSDLAEIFDVHEDEIAAPDLYFGGEYGDDDAVDAVLVDGEIVATFGRAITLDDLAAIYASPANSHVDLRRPMAAPILLAAE